MKTYLLACRTLKAEIEFLMEKHHLSYQKIAYIESGLHNHTETLRKAVKDKLAELPLQSGDRLLLCFGLCGNMVEGMVTGDYETVMPKTQDCIMFLLGSEKKRQQLQQEEISYYLTPGWLYGRANMHKEYLETCRLYGEDTANEIYQQIFSGYQSVALLDTGLGDYEAFCQQGKEIARDFALETRRIKGNLGWLTLYLKQEIEILQQEDKVVIYPPHSKMSFKDFINIK